MGGDKCCRSLLATANYTAAKYTPYYSLEWHNTFNNRIRHDAELPGKIHASRVDRQNQKIHRRWLRAGTGYAHHGVRWPWSVQSALHRGIFAIGQHGGHVTADVQMATNHSQPWSAGHGSGLRVEPLDDRVLRTTWQTATLVNWSVSPEIIPGMTKHLQSKTSGDCRSRIFYRQDALPIAKSTDQLLKVH